MHIPRITLYIHLFICGSTLLDENGCGLRFSKIDSEKMKPRGSTYFTRTKEREGVAATFAYPWPHNGSHALRFPSDEKK